MLLINGEHCGNPPQPAVIVSSMGRVKESEKLFLTQSSNQSQNATGHPLSKKQLCIAILNKLSIHLKGFISTA